MAGTRQFDDALVLEQVAEVFWRKGYDATSIQDLEGATGLGRGSLYNAFGDKRALFSAALRQYGAGLKASLSLLDGEDAREGVRRLLAAVIARMRDPESPRGCLMTNICCSCEDALDIVAEGAAALRAMTGALETAIMRAKARGQIPSDTDARALARFYAAVIQSLAVTHKATGDIAALEDVVSIAMRAWPDPGSKASP